MLLIRRFSRLPSSVPESPAYGGRARRFGVLITALRLPPNGGTHETYFHPLADRIDFVARLQVIARTKGSSSDPYPTITPRPVYAGRSANSDRIVPTPISYTLMPVSAHPVWWFVDCLTGAPKRTNLISAPIRASRHAGQKLLISRTPSHHGRVWPHRVYWIMCARLPMILSPLSAVSQARRVQAEGVGPMSFFLLLRSLVRGAAP